MPKKISYSQQIGQNSVAILKSKLEYLYSDKSIHEFSFVEIPQQEDFGLDGILNIFVDKSIQNINPFIQIKGTNTEVKSESTNKILGHKVYISNDDWNFLKNKPEISILVGVNVENKKVYYVFPQFEDKPKSLYLENFPHQLENEIESKKKLYDCIKKYQIENTQEYKNSLALHKGHAIPLNNGFGVKLEKYSVISNGKNKPITVNLKINKTGVKEMGADLNVHLLNKDKIIIKKEWIDNYEEFDGWEVPGLSKSQFGDIIFRRPPLYSGEILLENEIGSILIDGLYYYSIEKNMYIFESSLPKDATYFWFYVESGGKFIYNINYSKINSQKKLNSIKNFVDGLKNTNLKIKLKIGYCFMEVVNHSEFKKNLL